MFTSKCCWRLWKISIFSYLRSKAIMQWAFYKSIGVNVKIVRQCHCPGTKSLSFVSFTLNNYIEIFSMRNNHMKVSFKRAVQKFRVAEYVDVLIVICSLECIEFGCELHVNASRWDTISSCTRFVFNFSIIFEVFWWLQRKTSH